MANIGADCGWAINYKKPPLSEEAAVRPLVFAMFICPEAVDLSNSAHAMGTEVCADESQWQKRVTQRKEGRCRAPSTRETSQTPPSISITSCSGARRIMDTRFVIGGSLRLYS